jgi:hypothetical protein
MQGALLPVFFVRETRIKIQESRIKNLDSRYMMKQVHIDLLKRQFTKYVFDLFS